MAAKQEFCRKCKELGKTYVCEKCGGCESCCECLPADAITEEAAKLWHHRDSRRGLMILNVARRARKVTEA